MAERRFTEKQTAEILREAARLQNAGPGGSSSSESELIAAAREIGIDPQFVEDAMAKVDAGGEARTSGFWGGPFDFNEEIIVPGDLDAEAWEDTIADLRRTFREEGKVESREGVREWSTTGGGVTPVTVTVRRQGDSVRVGVSGRSEGLAIVIYMMGILPMIITVGLSGAAARFFPGAGLIVGFTLIAALFLGVRALAASSARSQDQKLRGVLGRLSRRFAEPDAVRAPLASEEEAKTHDITVH